MPGIQMAVRRVISDAALLVWVVRGIRGQGSGKGRGGGGRFASGLVWVDHSGMGLLLDMALRTTIALMLFASSDVLADECEVGVGIAVLVSPENLVAGQAARVLVATEEPFGLATGKVVVGDQEIPLVESTRGGGPPYWAALSFVPASAAEHRLTITLDGHLHCQQLTISHAPVPRRTTKSVWVAKRSWSRAYENLYSAWLEHLFSDDEGTSWPALHDLTRMTHRNLLHNHLALGEDAATGKNTLRLQPDCADNPYFLRAYFAWKMALPFGFYQCDRGRKGRDPVCEGWNPHTMPRGSKRPARAFHLFLRKLKSAVQSGSARTALDARSSDLYPLPLTPTALRPGTVYADPFGHTLMLVRRQPQSADKPGMLMAVDAQPDGTVTIKRFWRGNFLFETNSVIGGPGFKAFRPIVKRHGQYTPLTNRQLAETEEFQRFDLEQRGMETTAFYDAMSRVVNPLPVDPEKAYKQLHDALYEQVLTRVKAVANGEGWKARNRGRSIKMPQGISIFQTSGPWEDFSTPARDLRLLIALDAVLDFPDRLRRIPEAFALPKGTTAKEMAGRLRTLSNRWTSEQSFAYERSDGAQQPLTLATLFERIRALEMGYNPNDCPEVRWGAAKGSAEMATCEGRAPRAQKKRMKVYRGWFQARRRPAWN